MLETTPKTLKLSKGVLYIYMFENSHLVTGNHWFSMRAECPVIFYFALDGRLRHRSQLKAANKEIAEEINSKC